MLQSLDASYHLFHGSLDMLWLHLTSLYQLNVCRQQADCPQSQQSESSHSLSLEQATRALVADLVELALARFHKVSYCLHSLITGFTNKLGSSSDKIWVRKPPLLLSYYLIVLLQVNIPVTLFNSL